MSHGNSLYMYHGTKLTLQADLFWNLSAGLSFLLIILLTTLAFICLKNVQFEKVVSIKR